MRISQIQHFIIILIVTTHLLLLKTVSNFPERYISISANNEHDFLNKLWHKILNMLPKLHKSKEINKTVEINGFSTCK